MRTLVAYASRYGTTRLCARSIAQRLEGEVDLFDLRRERFPEVPLYDSVVIGGPIYGGRLMYPVMRFCDRNRQMLLRRTVGLFISCLYQDEAAMAQLYEAFPPWLNAHSVVSRPVGGAIAYGRLNVIDRYLVGKVARMTADFETVNDEELSAIALAISSNVK